MYQSGQPDNNLFRSALLDGCRWYDDQFKDEFIDDDQTWRVTRIMAYISAISSGIAMITSWLFVISPLPAFFFWPGFLLPMLMTSFLTEGAKFLFFDTYVCRDSAWFPSGADSLPRAAEECTLGQTGAYSIASVAVSFICLILVCIKAPEKRVLEPHYGTDFEDSDGEAGRKFGNPEPDYFQGSPEIFGNGQQVHGTSPPNEVVAEDVRPMFSGSSEDLRPDYIEDFGDIEEEDLASARLKTADVSKGIYPSKPNTDQGKKSVVDHHCASKMSANTSVISESRLYTRDKMKKNSEQESTELIESFVNELNACFEMERTEDGQHNKQN
eukprot:scaffold2271_cov130-Cylindrotheca_fusiformis.AAC.8